MRNRWSLFLSGFIVFAAWYVIAYAVTSRTFVGVLTGLAFGLSAVIGGMIIGAGFGVAARAVELHSIHREVRRGDARDGARVTLGKLPKIVPVVRHAGAANAPEPLPPQSPTAPEPVPISLPNHAPEHGDSDAPDAITCGTAGATLGPAAHAQNTPLADRLAIECARFVASHEAVAVTPGANGSSAAGAIDRASHPKDFAAFMTLVSALAGEGVDVSRVTVSAGPDDLPSAVTFPVSNDDDGELK